MSIDEIISKIDKIRELEYGWCNDQLPTTDFVGWGL